MVNMIRSFQTRLQLGLLVGSAEKTKARAPRSKGQRYVYLFVKKTSSAPMGFAADIFP